MNQSNEKAIEILKLKAKELHDRPRILNPFTKNPEADVLLNNIELYPHIFVFGCIFNRFSASDRKISDFFRHNCKTFSVFSGTGSFHICIESQ